MSIICKSVDRILCIVKGDFSVQKQEQQGADSDQPSVRYSDCDDRTTAYSRLIYEVSHHEDPLAGPIYSRTPLSLARHRTQYGLFERQSVDDHFPTVTSHQEVTLVSAAHRTRLGSHSHSSMIKFIINSWDGYQRQESSPCLYFGRGSVLWHYSIHLPRESRVQVTPVI